MALAVRRGRKLMRLSKCLLDFRSRVDDTPLGFCANPGLVKLGGAL